MDSSGTTCVLLTFVFAQVQLALEILSHADANGNIKVAAGGGRWPATSTGSAGDVTFPATDCVDSFTNLPLPFQLYGRFLPADLTFLATPVTTLARAAPYLSTSRFYGTLGASLGVEKEGATTDALALIAAGAYDVGAGVLEADIQASALLHLSGQLICNFKSGTNTMSICVTCVQSAWAGITGLVDLQDEDAVVSILNSSSLSCGASIPMSAKTAVAQAVNAIGAFTRQLRGSAAELPISFVASVAKLSVCVQSSMVPAVASGMTTANVDVDALVPFTSDFSACVFPKAVNYTSIAAVLGLSVPTTRTVNGNAIMVGPLIGGCTLAYQGLLALEKQEKSLTGRGSFTVANAQNGFFEIAPGCEDAILTTDAANPVRTLIKMLHILPTFPSEATIFLSPGSALATAIYVGAQSSGPSFPITATLAEVYSSFLGGVNSSGFDFWTRTGTTIPWAGSAVQVACFAADTMLATVVNMGALLLGGALAANSVDTSNQGFGILSDLATRGYSAKRLADKNELTALLYSQFLLATSDGVYSSSEFVTRPYYGRKLASQATETQTALLAVAGALAASNQLASVIGNKAVSALKSGDVGGNSLDATALVTELSLISKVVNEALAAQLRELAKLLNAYLVSGDSSSLAALKSKSSAVEAAFTSDNLNLAVSNAVINSEFLPDTVAYPQEAEDDSWKTALAIGLGVGGGLAILIGLCTWFYCRWRKRRSNQRVAALKLPAPAAEGTLYTQSNIGEGTVNKMASFYKTKLVELRRSHKVESSEQKEQLVPLSPSTREESSLWAQPRDS
eukprot:gene9429-4059_t